MIWLVGMLVLLPVDIVKLPLNMILVDAWILMALPILWSSFLRGHQITPVSYLFPMWLILLASFASTFAAPAPKSSLVVILKEIYAFVWFITLVAVLVTLSARDFRRFLIVWGGVVLLHGFVIIAQFLSPAFWQFTISLGGRAGEYDIYRPSGLFLNANSAAIFQLLGFVPLMLVSPSHKIGLILGLLLFPTMLATGSMGATVAFLSGLMVAVVALSLSGHLTLIIKIFVRLGIALCLLAGLMYFIVSHNERYQAHFERIFLGRAERSSEGRFDLWQRGLNAFSDNNVLLWGVGPENFREVDPTQRDNQLHNDFLAFSVERGLLGTLGLILLAVLVAGRAAYLALIAIKYPNRASLGVVVFLAAIVATVVESLTHQVFHFRELWLVLAVQEAMLCRMTAPARELASVAHTPARSSGHCRGSVVQPDMMGVRLDHAD